MDSEEGFKTENKLSKAIVDIWVSENLVNTKYRKYHCTSSDELIVIHQSSMTQRTRLSELIEIDQWPYWEVSLSYLVESYNES